MYDVGTSYSLFHYTFTASATVSDARIQIPFGNLGTHNLKFDNIKVEKVDAPLSMNNDVVFAYRQTATTFFEVPSIGSTIYANFLPLRRPESTTISVYKL